MHSKKGERPRKKAPAKIFVEKDFYTIRKADGERDLVLEHGLSQLESRYVALRRNKLDHRLPLNAQDRVNLAAFVAAMFARTKSRQEFIREQWQGVLELMEHMSEAMRDASPLQRKQMARALAPLPGEENRGMDIDEVKQIVEAPVQSFLVPSAAASTPFLARMPFAIIEVSEPAAFITSDAPCVFFDPELLESSPGFAAGGLISPTIEVSMPLSPRQYILYGHLIRFGCNYLPLSPDNALVDQINRRTYAYADESVVSSRNVIELHWL
jgi:Protein of unknown function (DUF4238)